MDEDGSENLIEKIRGDRTGSSRGCLFRVCIEACSVGL